MRKNATISGISLRFIARFLSEDESRQFVAGEMAAAFRNDETLQSLGELTPTSRHYLALYLSRTGAFDEAEQMLGPLITSAPPLLRARALVTLGTIELQRLDVGAAELCYRRAAEYVSDRFTAAHVVKARAILAALRGKHQDALAELERGFLLVHMLPQNYPLRLDFNNSIAVELTEIGRFDDARRVIASAVESSLSRLYPEWIETAADERLQYGAAAVPVSALPPIGRVLHFPPTESIAAERLLQMRYKGAHICMNSAGPELLSIVEALSKANPKTVHAFNVLMERGEEQLDLACHASRMTADLAKRLSKLAAMVEAGLESAESSKDVLRPLS